MSCEDWQVLIEEYLEGELDSRTALKVRQHLDGCPSCSSVLKSLSAEQSIYANYKSDVEISPELWVGVHQRLQVDRPLSSLSTRETFASWLRNIFVLPPVSGPVAVGLVVLAVVLTVVVMRYISSPREVAPERAVIESTSQTTPPPKDEMAVVTPGKPEAPLLHKDKSAKHIVITSAAADRRFPSARSDVHKTKDPRRLVREAEQKYLAAIAMLSRNVDRKKSRLDPATMVELEQALSSIDRTIAATRKVVRQHPDDPVAAQYMLTAYAKKVDVLRELVDY